MTIAQNISSRVYCQKRFTKCTNLLSTTLSGILIWVTEFSLVVGWMLLKKQELRGSLKPWQFCQSSCFMYNCGSFTFISCFLMLRQDWFKRIICTSNPPNHLQHTLGTDITKKNVNAISPSPVLKLSAQVWRQFMTLNWQQLWLFCLLPLKTRLK